MVDLRRIQERQPSPPPRRAWDECKRLAQEQLSNKRLFVMDVFCGANHDSRMAIRFIMEVAWQAHFVKNMFIPAHPGGAGELPARLHLLQRRQGQGGEL